ncbi:hypothetical protein KM043_015601 [Ampulex compressa]|nr:hypothetical protein KM043_015601 [Ampulex compressa]
MFGVGVSLDTSFDALPARRHGHSASREQVHMRTVQPRKSSKVRAVPSEIKANSTDSTGASFRGVFIAAEELEISSYAAPLFDANRSANRATMNVEHRYTSEGGSVDDDGDDVVSNRFYTAVGYKTVRCMHAATFLLRGNEKCTRLIWDTRIYAPAQGYHRCTHADRGSTDTYGIERAYLWPHSGARVKSSFPEEGSGKKTTWHVRGA